MENRCGLFCLTSRILLLLLLLPISSGQLSPSESRILFQVQKILEFPPVLRGWTNWTNFCYLPPSPSPSLRVVCSDNHVTELTVVGNKSSSYLDPKPARGSFVVSEKSLSERFSIDSLFTVLTKLSSLKVLSLVSLGIWGPLPGKINRFRTLEVLNISSNFLYGEIPGKISSIENLKSLVLADNLFNGSVPDLSSLTALEDLDLGGNFLGSKFPTLGNQMVSIVLRNNMLRSEIPSKLHDSKQLHRLDVSSNDFVGPIPSTLFSLPSIQYLNLARNKLSGALPVNISCNERLAFIDLSHNYLIGRLPLCIEANSSNRVVIFSWNCLSSGKSNFQYQRNVCHREALAVKPPISRDKKSESSSKLGLILGLVGGVVGGVVAIGLLVLAILRRRETKKLENNKFDKNIIDKASVGSSLRLLVDARHVSPAMTFGALGLPQYRVFTLEEIEEATNNFDPLNLMGQGSQGQLYKGWLSDGPMVVVRCLKLKQRHSTQSLLQHMEVLPKLRHRHLVSILGHCIVTYQDQPNSSNTVFLVFEYVSNGTLRTHLIDGRKREMIKWPQRIAVTIGITRGIQFLHNGITPSIRGNDLKIENILLDDNLNPKISNYNFPMPSRVGTESPFIGVEADEHCGRTEHGEKDDVYQLGVILLEVITGKQITSQKELDALRTQLEKGLTDGPSKLRGATDPSMRGTFAYESLRTTVEITVHCLLNEPGKRPSIEDVLWNLQYSVQVQEGWNSSENLGTKS